MGSGRNCPHSTQLPLNSRDRTRFRPRGRRPVLPARHGPGPQSAAREGPARSEEHTSELQSRQYLVCRLLLEKKKKTTQTEAPQSAECCERLVPTPRDARRNPTVECAQHAIRCRVGRADYAEHGT